MASHDLGDMELLRTRLEAWMRAKIPDGKSLQLGEMSFPEESGESSVSLILKARKSGKDVRYICRMKPRESQVFDEHDLALQYRLMQLVGASGIPVPPLLGLEEDSSLLGSEFYLMGFVEGQVPPDNPPYAFGSWVTELGDDQRATMWNNGLATLARIHSIKLEEHDFSGVPGLAPNAAPVQHELDKLNSLFTEEIKNSMSPLLAEAMTLLNMTMPSDGERRLCWGDSRPGNIIWRDLEPAAVIDWEMASIADPLLDVSWWYWVDYINSVGLGSDRLGGLPELDDLYENWQSLTGLPVVASKYFDLFSVVRYAVILERKFLAMQKSGLGSVENFAVPVVARLLYDQR